MGKCCEGIYDDDDDDDDHDHDDDELSRLQNG